MPTNWRKDLETGIVEIDNQHKELFNRINILLAACREGKGKDEIGNIIVFLEKYTLDHFGAEENYMERYSYANYPAHKKEHEQFKKDLSELKKRFEKEGPSGLFCLQINQKIVNWLIIHIGQTDMEMAGFLKGKI